MGLADALVVVPQPERGGEIAQRGFDYQSCWALSQMLEYELESKDYVFIFEYHDDVLILDSEEHPQKLTFAQVKTKETHWTWAPLRNATQQKPISIVGKLFLHQKNFPNYEPQLLFVTNAYFSFYSGGKSFFSVDDLIEKEKTNLEQKIHEQTGISKENINLSALKFVQSTLSLDDHITHLKGKVCQFIDKYYGSDCALNANALTSLLEFECRQKSKYKSSDISCFNDLVAKKGFSSKVFRHTLSSLFESKKLQPDWEMAHSIFNDCGKSQLDLIRLQAIFSRICISLNKANTSAENTYLNLALSLYNQSDLHADLKSFIVNTISSIDIASSDYSIAMRTEEKECIVVYSIIKKLLEEDNS